MVRAFTAFAALILLTGLLYSQPKAPDGDKTKTTGKPKLGDNGLDKPKTYDDMTEDEKAMSRAGASAAGGMSLLCVGFIVLASLFFTFIPGMIASARGHDSQLAIWLVCFLLGWTGIGWIVALIWSFASTGHTTTVIVERERSRRRREYDEDDDEDDRPRRRRS